MSADGYLVRGFRDGLDGNLYNFLSPRAHPELIVKRLEEVNAEWGHGCVVPDTGIQQLSDEGVSMGNRVKSSRLQLRPGHLSRQTDHRGMWKYRKQDPRPEFVAEDPRARAE